MVDPQRIEHVIETHLHADFASGLLLRSGFRQVMNVTGGFDVWKAAGLAVAQAVRA